MQISISCDFDGTITLVDTVDAILETFAEPEWREVEKDWETGKLGSRECLGAQTALLRVTPTDLDAFIDDIAVDADAKEFFADCVKLSLPVSVVSDGYDWVVRRVLGRMGLRGLPVVANRLVHMGDDRWSLRFPYSAVNCGSGVCKCAVVNQPAKLVHIGDGRSDMCVSDKCDVVFAKGRLLEHRNRLGLESIGFETFATVRALLPALPVLEPQAATRIA